MEVLRDRGVDFAAFNHRGSLFIHNSHARSDLALCQWLLAMGTRVTRLSRAGPSPLDGVTSGEVVRALVAAGADVNNADCDGMTPLHAAQSAEAVEALVEAGARVDAADRRGRTPLFTAGGDACLALLRAGGWVAMRDGGSSDLWSWVHHRGWS